MFTIQLMQSYLFAMWHKYRQIKVNIIAYFHNSLLCKGRSKCIDKSKKILLSLEHICRHLSKDWIHIHALVKEKRILQ